MITKLNKSLAKFSIIVLFSVFSLVTFLLFLKPNGEVQAQEDSGYTIIEDCVKWENNLGLLKVCPHTCYDNVCLQYANATSKLDTAKKLNISFIFPEEITGKIWLWQNYSHTVRVPDVENCTVSAECENIINSTMCETYYEWTEETLLNQTCNYIQDNICYWDDTCRVYDYEEQWYYDWNDKTHLMNHLEYNNKHYYYILDVPFKALETKQIKWQYETKIKEMEGGWGSSGKWELYLWRGDYKNPTQYVKLDPWWNTTWDYRTNFTITEQSGQALTNYTVKIGINTSDTNTFTNFYCGGERWINSTGDELNFYTENCSDSTTYNSTYWVQIPSLSASGSETISLYYGNTSAVTDLSDGANTFVDFDDFEYSDSPENHGWSDNAKCTLSTVTDPVKHGSRALKLRDSSTSGACTLDRNFTNQTRIDVHLYMRSEGTTQVSHFEIRNFTGSRFTFIGGSAKFNYWNRTDTWIKLGVDIVSNTWYEIETILNTTDDFYESIDIDGINRLTDDESIIIADELAQTRLREGGYAGTSNSYWDLYFVRKYTKPEPSYSQGSEESVPGAPTFSNPQTNNTFKGEPTNFTLDWEDTSGLSGYIFSTDNTGKWENASWVQMTGTSNTSWNVTTLNSTAGIVVTWKFYANDTDNTWVESSDYTLTTEERPQWSDNSTNNTVAGNVTEFRLKWSDNENLHGHIFSLDNCTGTFVNKTFQELTNGTTIIEELYVDGNDTSFDEWYGKAGSEPWLGDNDDRIYEYNAGDKQGNFTFTNHSVSAMSIAGVNLSLEVYTTLQDAGDHNITVYLYDGAWKEIWKLNITQHITWHWRTIDITSYLDTFDKINNAEVMFEIAGVSLGLNDRFIRRALLNVSLNPYPNQAWINSTSVYTINDTVGCTIRWKDYANDTDGNWNVSDEFSFMTIGPWLNVTLNYPSPDVYNESSPLEIARFSNLPVNATTECKNADCNSVDGTLRFNGTQLGGGRLLWKGKYSGSFDEQSIPIYVDGVVYLNSMGYDQISAINATDGSSIWNYSAGTANNGFGGPTYYEGIIYSAFNNVSALNASTGEEIWSYYEAGKEFSQNVAVDEDYVIAIDYPNGAVIVLNRSDGTKIWDDPLPLLKNATSEPLLFDDYVIVAGYNDTTPYPPTLYALNVTDGSQIWNFSYSGSGFWDTSPILYEDKIYIGSRGDYMLRAINLTNGVEVWSADMGSVTFSTPSVHAGVVFIGTRITSQLLMAFNASTGESIWNFSTTGTKEVYNQPSISGGLVFFNTLDSLTAEGIMFAVNETDGSQVWNYTITEDIYGYTSIGDGKIFVQTDDWYVYAFEFGTGSGNYTMIGYDSNRTGYSPNGLKYVPNPLSCGSMSQDDSCTLNWTINMTGSVNESYKIDVNFSSSKNIWNDTDNAVVKIVTAAGQNYYFNMSQTLSVSEVSLRTFGGIKAILQPSTLSTILGRLSSLFKILSQSLALEDILSRIYTVLKTLSQSLNLVDILSRIYGSLRALTQALNITDALSRVYGRVAALAQVIDVTDLVSKLRNVPKAIVQSIKITDVLERAYASFRAIFQPLEITDILTSLKRTPRTITQALAITDIVSRLYSGFRTLIQQLQLVDVLTRLRTIPKALTQSIKISDITSRTLSSFRTLIQSLALMDVVEGVVPIIERAMSLLLSVADALARTLDSFRINTQTIGITDVLGRIFGGYRVLTQALKIDTVVSRLYNGFRVLSQALDITTLVSRLRNVPRALAQTFNVESVVERFYSSFRKIIQTIKVTDVLTKLRSVFKTLTQAIDVTDVLARLFSSFRETTQTVVMTDVLTKLRSVSRTVIQSLNITDLVDRIYSAFRELLQPLSVTDVLTRAVASFREIPQTLVLTDVVSRIRNISRAIIRSIDITDFVSRVYSGFISLAQVLRITDVVSKVYGSLRALTQTLGVTDILSRLYGGLRAMTQPIGITDIPSRLYSGFRAVAQTLQLTDIVSRLRSVPIALIQVLNIETITTRLFSSYRTIAQSLSLVDIVSGIRSVPRLLSQAINITTLTSRIYGSFRTIVQALNIDTITSRLIASFRVLTQSLKITDILSYTKVKVGEVFLSISIVITDIVSRTVSLSKALTQALILTDLVSGIREIPITLTQTIQFFPPKTKVYNVTQGWTNAVTTKPPLVYAPAGETSVDIDNVTVSDDEYITTSSSDYPYHKFLFLVEEKDINWIEVNWEGHTNTDGTIYLYVWNYSEQVNGNWTELDSGSGTSDFVLNKTIYNISDIMLGQNITILAQDPPANEIIGDSITLKVGYVKKFVINVWHLVILGVVLIFMVLIFKTRLRK